MKNQELVFHPKAILVSIENLNGSYLANGTHMNKKYILGLEIVYKYLKIHGRSMIVI